MPLSAVGSEGLHPVKAVLVNEGRLCIFIDNLFFRAVVDDLLALVGLFCGFKVHRMP